MFNISNILEYIKGLFNSFKTPQQSTPKALIYTGTISRSGMSYRELAAEIISCQEQVGVPQGLLADGSNNIVEAMEAVRVQKIIEHLMTNAVIEVVIPIGSIQTTVTGMAGIIPVTGTGINTGLIKGKGIIK